DDDQRNHIQLPSRGSHHSAEARRPEARCTSGCKSVSPAEAVCNPVRPTQTIRQTVCPAEPIGQTVRVTQTIRQPVRPADAIRESVRSTEAVRQTVRAATQPVRPALQAVRLASLPSRAPG